ncbi:DUF4180 domain-containing protein [Streptomyces sp. B1866]|uniref:DUF4180 domain-containing protein n=1 Tax=Streptomyces sp. B1866 TaxID=3075431 RepID=UPI00288F8D03|nr:DUF4180 domain-containing protein [Streptomyces sp. B1866]MDT3395641.1 DUF4180 domain-containing protein [Streptomyces sp. B1866]
MSGTLQSLHGTPVFVCADDGEPLRTARDALDVIGEAGYLGADWVALPAARLADDFFQLRTGVAGEIVQKFANYRLRLAVLGDVSRHTAASTALRDFVRECDRGNQLWFLPDLAALGGRLAAAAG